jgi:hypothetical protein
MNQELILEGVVDPRFTERNDIQTGVVEGSSIWYSHVNGKVCRGEYKDPRDGIVRPTWDEKIFTNLDQFVRNKNLHQAGKKPEGGQFGGLSKEWYSRIVGGEDVKSRLKKDYGDDGYQKRLEGAMIQAGILTQRDYPTYKSATQQVQLKIKAPLDSVLFSAVTKETTDTIDVSILDTFIPPGVSRNIGDFDYIYAKKGTFTRTQFQALEKDGAHIAWNNDFLDVKYGQTASQSLNIRQMHLDAIPIQMERSKILKIIAVITAIPGTAVTGGVWGAFTGNNSTNNPIPDLKTFGKAIATAGGSMNTWVSNADADVDYSNNTFTKGDSTNRTGPITTFFYGNRVDQSEVPGVGVVQKKVIDINIPTSWVAFYDIDIMKFLQGPQRQYEYNDPRLRQNGRIWIDYNLMVNRDVTKSKRLTGVAP